MLEEPITRTPASFPSRYNSLFNDPFFNSPSFSARPALDVSEEGNKYIVEVELPGVPKENVDVRIGDHGHSLTIEGKVINTNRHTAAADNATAANENQPSSSETAGDSTTTITNQAEQPKQLAVEHQFVANTSFTRTVWLSRPVDGNSVSAQLKDGVLTLTLPKSEDKGSVKVSVE